MRRSWIVAGLLLAWAANAGAAEPAGYVGVSAGQSQIKAGYTADGFSASIDQRQASYKVFAGALFGVVGLEGGYIEFGHPKVVVGGTAVDVSATGFDAFATLNLPVGPARFFVKGGALNWKADAKVEGISADQSGTDPAYGAGLSVRLTSRLAARAEYEKFDIGHARDFNLVSAGLELTF